MAPALYAFFIIALGLRVGSLLLSRHNEEQLRARGAVEYGAETSRLLAILHAAVYLGCAAEGVTRGAQLDFIAQVGIGVYAFSLLALGLVLWSLGRVWTVRLLFLPDHPLDRGWLFRLIRHPNYFLNILPELIALIVIFDAWATLAVVFPAYVVTLAIRILEEERALRSLPPAATDTNRDAEGE
jgi:isoprenylcysteine carboxyl methyltransferase (ICMT) family protein YpbQ